MAISKQAKNLGIKIENNYQLIVGGKLEKMAEIVNIEAVDENLTLSSGKKIVSKGNK